MKILIISSYPPRECGLATFSKDIVNALKRMFGNTIQIEICALQNEENQYCYGQEVTYTLSVPNLKNYSLLAEQINKRNDIKLVCIQHEFGLFGGEYGEYILPFILALNKPITTVFHTVLPKPNEKLKKIVHAIVDLNNKIVAQTKNSKKILVRDYGCDESKITVIPHGNHSFVCVEKEKEKKKYGFSDKIVLSTFGLISENKNIETVLYALKDIVIKHPEIIYLILGKTHPEVIKGEGEQYREKLHKIVEELHLANNVVFINEYLELKRLLEYLKLSDIYLFSSKDPNQAVSGTFTYAMSCGCTVISTPIPHAVEILISNNGILLKEFNKPEEFKQAILRLIENKEERTEMGNNAFVMAHATKWENIAIQYRLLFNPVIGIKDDLKFEYPKIKLDHIKELTTDFGILQFSKFSLPDPDSGYTLDDNARALINMVMYYELSPADDVLKLINIYLNFIEGMQKENGWFNNYKDFDQKLTAQNDEVNLEDANGRALWSLGTVISYQQILPEEIVEKAINCWNKAITWINNISSPRAIAYTIKGLYNHYTISKEENIIKQIEKLADELLRHYHLNSKENWHWYEDYMTYANNILPEAMMYSYLAAGKPNYKKIALTTFDFLLSHYFMKGQLKVISNRGWFKKENERVFHGEQPIEVATTIITLDLFYEVTKNQKYKDQIKPAFNWFLGNNHLNQIMYNPENGASYDGLEDMQVNLNQGAESTLCFFKTQIIMQKYA
jgi:glycosyltransferase involved in cell wall biosynthesis